jgi:hemerythrin
MELLEWNSKLSVHVESIDRQHRLIITAINDLYDALAADASEEVLDDLFVRIMDITSTHFSYEDVLMVNNGYPEAAQHLTKHNELMATIGKMSLKARDRAQLQSSEMVQFFNSWLGDHILGQDMKLGQFLASLNIK